MPFHVERLNNSLEMENVYYVIIAISRYVWFRLGSENTVK